MGDLIVTWVHQPYVVLAAFAGIGAVIKALL